MTVRYCDRRTRACLSYDLVLFTCLLRWNISVICPKWIKNFL